MAFSEAAWERAMEVREVVMRAVSGEIHWFRAAEILGISGRTLRRWRERHERFGFKGLMDKRRRVPSPRRVPLEDVEKILRLYRGDYRGWNVRHFHEDLVSKHAVKLSYSFVKHVLQEAGLVRRKQARGRHRLRREPRPCFGEMVLIDGSRHRWLERVPEARQVLISVVDDATSTLLYAQLWDAETVRAILSAVRDVVERFGIPAALYSDRAGWAFETPKAGGPVDKLHLTRVGEVLKRLGIEHIPSYSPQARGRSERVHRTLQDRLVNELKKAGIDSSDEANRYIRERYLRGHNQKFSRAASEPASAFVPLGEAQCEEIFYEAEERTVAKDNTVSFQGVTLQIAAQPGRRSCAGLRVEVRRQLDGSHSIRRGAQVLGWYDADGRSLVVSVAKPTHQNAPGSTPASRLDLRVIPAISTYGLKAGSGRSRVPACGRLRLTPAGTGSRLPAKV